MWGGGGSGAASGSKVWERPKHPLHTQIEYVGARITGARMRHYLLEKVRMRAGRGRFPPLADSLPVYMQARVVGPHVGERNYHIFYQVSSQYGAVFVSPHPLRGRNLLNPAPLNPTPPPSPSLPGSSCAAPRRKNARSWAASRRHRATLRTSLRCRATRHQCTLPLPRPLPLEPLPLPGGVASTLKALTMRQSSARWVVAVEWRCCCCLLCLCRALTSVMPPRTPQVRRALTAVGIGADVQASLWACLAGLLHLGGMMGGQAGLLHLGGMRAQGACPPGGWRCPHSRPSPRTASAAAAAAAAGNVAFSENDKGEAAVRNGAVAACAAGLLGCESLPAKLVSRLMRVKGRRSAYEVRSQGRGSERGASEPVPTPCRLHVTPPPPPPPCQVRLSERQALGARDSLAKAVYERLFSWLIGRVNATLASRGASSGFIGGREGRREAGGGCELPHVASMT